MNPLKPLPGAGAAVGTLNFRDVLVLIRQGLVMGAGILLTFAVSQNHAIDAWMMMHSTYMGMNLYPLMAAGFALLVEILRRLTTNGNPQLVSVPLPSMPVRFVGQEQISSIPAIVTMGEFKAVPRPNTEDWSKFHEVTGAMTEDLNPKPPVGNPFIPQGFKEALLDLPKKDPTEPPSAA